MSSGSRDVSVECQPCRVSDVRWWSMSKPGVLWFDLLHVEYYFTFSECPPVNSSGTPCRRLVRRAMSESIERGLLLLSMSMSRCSSYLLHVRACLCPRWSLVESCRAGCRRGVRRCRIPCLERAWWSSVLSEYLLQSKVSRSTPCVEVEACSKALSEFDGPKAVSSNVSRALFVTCSKGREVASDRRLLHVRFRWVVLHGRA